MKSIVSMKRGLKGQIYCHHVVASGPRLDEKRIESQYVVELIIAEVNCVSMKRGLKVDAFEYETHHHSLSR